MKCNLHSILRQKSNFLMKTLWWTVDKGASFYVTKTLAVCTTHTNLLLTYVMNDRENTYENATWNSF